MSQKNIKQTKEAKQKYNHPIIDLLLDDKPKTREELCEILHVSDRNLRLVIAECSMHYPIIATSDKKGYRRAKNLNEISNDELQYEIEEVMHQIEEHKSRIKCLKKKMKPLIAWLKMAERRAENAE